MSDSGDFITSNDFNLLLLNVLKNSEEFENNCLITNKPLVEPIITLGCKHKFNYEPIYKEVIQQKTKINGLETTKLKLYQIKCPYCRHITDNLLPPREGFQTILAVNAPLKYCMGLTCCEYVYSSGIKKGKQCGKKGIHKYCRAHKKIMDKRKKKQKEKEKKAHFLKYKKNILEKKNSEDVNKMTVKQLKLYCKNNGIKKYSKLKKAQLLSLINSCQAPQKNMVKSNNICKNKIVTI